MINFNNPELKILKTLNTPAKIQDFLDKLPINFEDDGKGETCMSPLSVLRTKKAHCIEAAFLAALVIRMNKLGNGKALVVDMRATKDDFDHVIAVFQNGKGKNAKWGAISKSNHAVLRYREPVYRDIRELVMSYFHEYTDDFGKKTLREFSEPVDLGMFDDTNWITSEDNLWFMHDYLDSVKHYKILQKEQHKKLRLADSMERVIGKITEWKKR
ncbi:MAG: hypothetical protein AABX17_03670 [Nanoarchaeota archaeon]